MKFRKYKRALLLKFGKKHTHIFIIPVDRDNDMQHVSTSGLIDRLIQQHVKSYACITNCGTVL